MASIYPKNGKLYISYYEKVLNKRVRRQIALKIDDTKENRAKAKIIKKEIELELLKPKPILSFYYPLSEAFEDFLQTKKDKAESTIALYKNAFNKFIEINGDLFGSEVQEYHVQRYINSMNGYSRSSVAIFIRHISAFFNWLKEKRYIEQSFFKRMKVKPKPIEIIPDEDFEKILNQLSPKQRFYIEFLAYTGLRVSEALQVKWSDIDFDSNILHVRNTKGNRNDEFPLYPEVKEFLLEHREQGNNKVFKYASRSSLKFWYRINSKLNMNYNLHQIRKTFASKLVNSGVSIYDAKALLRHSTVAVTEKYYAKVEISRLGQEASKIHKKLPFVNIKGLDKYSKN